MKTTYRLEEILNTAQMLCQTDEERAMFATVLARLFDLDRARLEQALTPGTDGSTTRDISWRSSH